MTAGADATRRPQQTTRGVCQLQPIEPTAIAGDARFETEPNEFYAVVLVPMDSGDWRLELERRDTADAWLADRIEPVE